MEPNPHHFLVTWESALDAIGCVQWLMLSPSFVRGRRLLHVVPRMGIVSVAHADAPAFEHLRIYLVFVCLNMACHAPNVGAVTPAAAWNRAAPVLELRCLLLDIETALSMYVQFRVHWS